MQAGLNLQQVSVQAFKIGHYGVTLITRAAFKTPAVQLPDLHFECALLQGSRCVVQLL